MKCEMKNDPEDGNFVVCENCGFRVDSRSFWSAENCPRMIPGNEWDYLSIEIEKLAKKWEEVQVEKPGKDATPGAQIGYERALTRITMLHEAARQLRFVLKKARRLL